MMKTDITLLDSSHLMRKAAVYAFYFEFKRTFSNMVEKHKFQMILKKKR